MSIDTNCNSVMCSAHNTGADDDKYKTGACTYEIWNSITGLHRVSNIRAALTS